MRGSWSGRKALLGETANSSSLTFKGPSIMRDLKVYAKESRDVERKKDE